MGSSIKSWRLLAGASHVLRILYPKKNVRVVAEVSPARTQPQEKKLR